MGKKPFSPLLWRSLKTQSFFFPPLCYHNPRVLRQGFKARSPFFQSFHVVFVRPLLPFFFFPPDWQSWNFLFSLRLCQPFPLASFLTSLQAQLSSTNAHFLPPPPNASVCWTCPRWPDRLEDFLSPPKGSLRQKQTAFPSLYRVKNLLLPFSHLVCSFEYLTNMFGQETRQTIVRLKNEPKTQLQLQIK